VATSLSPRSVADLISWRFLPSFHYLGVKVFFFEGKEMMFIAASLFLFGRVAYNRQRRWTEKNLGLNY
jgi:hypothetical protein